MRTLIGIVGLAVAGAIGAMLTLKDRLTRAVLGEDEHWSERPPIR